MEEASSQNSAVTAQPRRPRGLKSCTPVARGRGITPIKRYHRHARSSFKSPVLASSKPKSPAPPTNLRDEVTRLRAEYAEAAEDVSSLEKKYCVGELQTYIDLFHEYNDIKDTTQMVLGRIAEIRQTTVKQLHEEYGLDPND